jgi:hypothetical protein
MFLMFKFCGIGAYVRGEIECPNANVDAVGADNWEFNDAYAKILITNNIDGGQMVHIGRCQISHDMWKALCVVHESRGHQTVVSIVRNLFRTNANEEDNIGEHVTKLKQYHEHINLLSGSVFNISDTFFKVIISSSLPPTWDSFTEPYVGGHPSFIELDPKRRMTSQELIGLIKEEYLRRKFRKQEHEPGQVTHAAYDRSAGYRQITQKPSQSLANHLSNNFTSCTNNSGDTLTCKFCKKRGHVVKECRSLGKAKCFSCSKIGHMQKDCRFPKNRQSQDKASNGSGGQGGKKSRKEEANNAKGEETHQHIAFAAVASSSDETMHPLDDEGEWEYHNFNSYDVNNYDSIDEHVIYYDWLADSATTSHICNEHEAFLSYVPIKDVPITGVGGLQAQAKGRRTIHLRPQCEGKTFILQLDNMLHVPSNRNNLISLGR